MRRNRVSIRVSFIVAASVCIGLIQPVSGQEEIKDSSEKKTVQPVFRVPKVAKLRNLVNVKTEENGNETKTGPVAKVADNTPTPAVPVRAPKNVKKETVTPVIEVQPRKQSHPLDQAVEMAYSGLEHMRKNVHDYTAIMVKRERVNNVVGEPEYIKVKIRNARKFDGVGVPFSIYMKFLKPRAAAGREVIWVDGQNKNQLVAHETGMLGFKRFYLDPNGMLAMRNQRYPITEAGMENMVVKLIEKAERDRKAGDCKVDYVKGAKINGRSCTLIRVTHDQRAQPYDFHIAKVYIDDQMNVPVRYVAYDWPSCVGGNPQLMEEYTFINVKLNVGLTNQDFSPDNPSYDFPKR